MIAHFSQRQLGLVLEFGRKILHLPLNYYETRRSGEIVSRLRDINEINNLVAQVVALPSQLFIAISFSFMLFYMEADTSGHPHRRINDRIYPAFVACSAAKTRNLLVLAAENQGVLVETLRVQW